VSVLPGQLPKVPLTCPSSQNYLGSFTAISYLVLHTPHNACLFNVELRTITDGIQWEQEVELTGYESSTTCPCHTLVDQESHQVHQSSSKPCLPRSCVRTAGHPSICRGQHTACVPVIDCATWLVSINCMLDRVVPFRELEPHVDLVDPALDLALENECNEQLLDLCLVHIELLSKISTSASVQTHK
jgi:hypothetical protein